LEFLVDCGFYEGDNQKKKAASRRPFDTDIGFLGNLHQGLRSSHLLMRALSKKGDKNKTFKSR